MSEQHPKSGERSVLTESEQRQLGQLGVAAFIVRAAKIGNDLHLLNNLCGQENEADCEEVEALAYEASLEHKALMDDMPEGSTINVKATSGNVLRIYSDKSGQPEKALRAGIGFHGYRRKTSVPSAVLRVELYPGGPFIEEDAYNNDGEYVITNFNPPKANG